MPRRAVPVPAPLSKVLRRVSVRPALGGKARGWLIAGTVAMPCRLGPSGLTARKREGDGATPRGSYALTACFFRADRLSRPPCRLPTRAARPDDGWCDDPRSAAYNQPIRLPHAAGHERMWRSDRLYDLGVVIDYNRGHPVKGRGSAIFMHVMSPGGTPTAGCVALHPQDLRRLLPRLSRHCRIVIG